MGINERERERREWREYEKELYQMRDLEREQKEREKERKAGSRVNFGFDEDEFTVALGKFLKVAGEYNSRQVGFGGLRAFDRAFMSPVEFKEQLKRTFGLNLSSTELGSLVSFFDEKEEGKIDCSSFLVSFFRYEFQMKQLKGKPE